MSLETRIEFLMKLLGGPEGLPPQLPPPEPTTYSERREDNDLPPPIVNDASIPKPALVQPHILPAARPPTMDTDGDAAHYPWDSDKGEAAPPGIKFAPFSCVVRYCYCFVGIQWRQPLATALFDADKVYARDWTLYYIHSTYGGFIPLVPEHELQTLIDDCNAAFPEGKFRISDDDRKSGLVIDFQDIDKQYYPRLLGRCNSRNKYKYWTNEIQYRETAMVIPDSDGDRSVEAFKAKIDAIRDASKAKKKAARARTHQDHLVKRQGMVKETLRTQRYLGLLPKKDEHSLLPDITNMAIAPASADQPPPHAFDNEPIFITIDCEAWEKPPRMVTEIGVATLDTRDLKGVPPGKIGENWHQYIRGRHFRIIEYKAYVNSEFVQGCPEGFEFGQSELVGKDSIASVLASCFREPFSKKENKSAEEDAGNPPTSPSSPDASADASPEPELRNIIVVGHDLGQDIAYCREFGFTPFNRPNILDTLDTAHLYRAHTQDPNPRALGNILYDFDLPGWHLHNAGNDAVYTLHALLAIAVAGATAGAEARATKGQEIAEARERAHVESARESVREELSGWEAEDSEDGGVSVVPLPARLGESGRRGGRGAGANGRVAGSEGQGGGRSPVLYTIGGAVLDV